MVLSIAPNGGTGMAYLAGRRRTSKEQALALAASWRKRTPLRHGSGRQGGGEMACGGLRGWRLINLRHL